MILIAASFLEANRSPLLKNPFRLFRYLIDKLPSIRDPIRYERVPDLYKKDSFFFQYVDLGSSKVNELFVNAIAHHNMGFNQ